MSRPERYFIGPNVRDAIRDTILRVGGTPLSEGDGSIPTRLQDIPRPAGSGTQVIKAYFWGAWVGGGIKEIAWTSEFNAPTVARAKNLFNQDILYQHVDFQQARVCFVIPEAGDGYEYVLLNAEC